LILGDKKMVEQVESIVLRKLDIDKFNEIVEENLREDNIAESCYTNFKDVVVETIIKEIHEITDKDGWKLKYWEKNAKEKIFDAFMKNSEIKALLAKKIGKGKYKYKKVIIKLDFPEEEKKRIAREYIDNLTIAIHYLEICLFIEEEENMDTDTIAKILSNEVYGILSLDEIKAEYINEEYNVNDIDIDVEEE